ncbi:hypothetical protein EB796_000661 [Bugula neritina]|uniref:Uncharacterized protein n=1 Tax=Bugula neritina TaxID=10212 RepID=A0A7J7KS48_BUGNE|nr:hypothetical protein EB796_000661 [Bugula neritina]
MGQAESRQERWEACGFGHVDRVRELLEEGVDVNWVSKTHDSCPIHAASQGKPEIVKMLIEAGCDVNVRDERKSTALHHAAMNGYTDCVKLLIEAGACVDVEDKNSWTPLHNAAYWAHSEVTEILIFHKADCAIKNKDARLPLHEVARSRSTDEKSIERITELLIERGCDIESKAGTDGFSDFTALMFASYHGHVSVVQQLLKANCNVNAQSSNKWTALHWASDRSHADVVDCY